MWQESKVTGAQSLLPKWWRRWEESKVTAPFPETEQALRDLQAIGELGKWHPALIEALSRLIDEGTSILQIDRAPTGGVARCKYKLADELGMILAAVRQGVCHVTEGATMSGLKTPTTIAELETILNSEDDRDITINHDGTITANERKGMTDEQINHMVDRFLQWRLPENFNPDAGISFKRTDYPMPVGTNLFTTEQATAMVRHMIEGLPNRR